MASVSKLTGYLDYMFVVLDLICHVIMLYAYLIPKSL